MPQEDSGLVLLIWIAWIYWCIYWLPQLQSREEAEKGMRQSGLSASPAEADAVSPPAAVPTSGNLHALLSEFLRREGASIDNFLAERLANYETIVAAFDSGDRDAISHLVSPQVRDVFSDAIATRETQPIETVFSQIAPPELVDGQIDGEHIEVSIRFVSESFKVIHGAPGRPRSKAPDRRRCVDIWTFARSLSSREGVWRVVATNTDFDEPAGAASASP